MKKKEKNKTIQDKSIVIVTHEATTGPAHDLREYINSQRSRRLLFIAHPLLYIPENYNKRSYWQCFNKGKEAKSGKSTFVLKLPELVMYVKDIVHSLYWVVGENRRSDIYIGVGNINAAVGIILRFFGFTNYVVFYSIDFVPKRFDNSIINSFYHRIERFAVNRSDVVWNLSPRMKQGRREKWGNDLGNQTTVPIGIWYDRISKNQEQSKNKYELIYLGTLLEKQGIDICIEAVDEIKKTIPNIRFTIIGSGPYKKNLYDLVRKLKLEKNVQFLGYIEKHSDVEKRISKGAIAFALYNPEKDTFSYYADPGKVKSYLACGLPILITDIPWIAKIVIKKKCGIIVKYRKEEIVKAVKSLISNPIRLKKYQENSRMLAKSYDWNIIFENVFSKIP